MGKINVFDKIMI